LVVVLAGGCDVGTPVPDPGVPAFSADRITLPLAAVDEPYERIVSAVGGWRPYVWSGDIPVVPWGLSFDPMEDGVRIYGRPTRSGAYSFDLTVTDDRGATATATVSLLVVDVIDLWGFWSLQLDVTEANAACPLSPGEEITYPVTIRSSGPYWRLTGFGGDPTSLLLGVREGADVFFNGAYSEAGGTLVVSLNLTLYEPAEMVGRMTFDWDADGRDGPDCSAGRASILVTRTGP